MLRFPRRTALALTTLFAGTTLQAQPYTQPLWAVDTVRAITYGWDTTYLGGIDTLKLDLFRPVGDGNASRPLLVAVHGGAWAAGTRQDLWPICQAAAQRGYVAATISYRLRHHVPQNVSISLGVDPCVYLPDSAELLRALYRAQQDLKGAIRFLKGHSAQDSTNACNVFLYGESAGAITSLTAAFLDEADERPAACGALPMVPDPNLLLGGCHVTGLPLTAAQRGRPDLGPVEGDLALNGTDARVAGIAAMYGALPTMALAEDWMQGPDTPAVFLYHQTCDAIVPNGTAPLLRDLSAYCAGGTWWSTHYPWSAGSAVLAPVLGSKLLANIQDAAVCNAVLGQFPFSFNCINVAQNGSFHYVNQAAVVVDSVFKAFSPVIVANEALPCGTTAIADGPPSARALLFPNPAVDALTVVLPEAFRTAQARLCDATGRVIRSMRMQGGRNLIDVAGLGNGAYILMFADAPLPAERVIVAR